MLLPAGLAGSGTAAPVCVHTLHDSTGCPRKRPMHRGNASWIGSRTCSPRTTHFILMQPGASRQVSWHQDSSYWTLSPSKTVTVWLAIADADARTRRLAWRATRGPDATGGLEGTRREPASVGSPGHTPDPAPRCTGRRGSHSGGEHGPGAGLASLVLPRAEPVDRPASPFWTDGPLLDAEAAPPGAPLLAALVVTRAIVRGFARWRGVDRTLRREYGACGGVGAALEQVTRNARQNPGSAPGSQEPPSLRTSRPAQGCHPI